LSEASFGTEPRQTPSDVDDHLSVVTTESFANDPGERSDEEWEPESREFQCAAGDERAADSDAYSDSFASAPDGSCSVDQPSASRLDPAVREGRKVSEEGVSQSSVSEFRSDVDVEGSMGLDGEEDDREQEEWGDASEGGYCGTESDGGSTYSDSFATAPDDSSSAPPSLPLSRSPSSLPSEPNGARPQDGGEDSGEGCVLSSLSSISAAAVQNGAGGTTGSILDGAVSDADVQTYSESFETAPESPPSAYSSSSAASAEIAAFQLAQSADAARLLRAVRAGGRLPSSSARRCDQLLRTRVVPDVDSRALARLTDALKRGRVCREWMGPLEEEKEAHVRGGMVPVGLVERVRIKAIVESMEVL
ncbi:hypothetical protein BDK51DRAFT_48873, partial [Blyttiomyces helicus]